MLVISKVFIQRDVGYTDSPVVYTHWPMSLEAVVLVKNGSCQLAQPNV